MILTHAKLPLYCSMPKPFSVIVSTLSNAKRFKFLNLNFFDTKNGRFAHIVLATIPRQN